MRIFGDRDQARLSRADESVPTLLKGWRVLDGEIEELTENARAAEEADKERRAADLAKRHIWPHDLGYRSNLPRFEI